MESIVSPVNTYTQSKQATTTRVSFAPSAKRHDGLSPVNTLLEDVVLQHLAFCAFISPRHLLAYLARDKRFRLLPALLKRIHHLLCRLNQSRERQRVALLPHGGGRQIFISHTRGRSLLDLYKVGCQANKYLVKYVHMHTYRYNHNFGQARLAAAEGFLTRESHHNW